MSFTGAILAILVVMGLTGCGDQPTTARFSVEAPNASPEELNETANVLLRRFSDQLPSRRASVTGRIDGHRIGFEFRGDSPPESELRYLAKTRGVLRMAASNTPLIQWMSDRDIVSSRCFKSENGMYFEVTLTPEAAKRLLPMTQRNLGKVLVTTLDGEVVIRATVSGAFGRQFESPIPEGHSVRLFCEVLKTGRLPVLVGNAQYHAVN